MKYLVFRFDIDTHKCIRDGVPNLLDIAEYYNVNFSFFLNLGRAISFSESVRNIILKRFMGRKEKGNDEIQMMSAIEKMGMKDYIEAAVINPRISSYREQIERLVKSNCEVGIHGGRNHALWHQYAADWNMGRIEDEVKWAIKQFVKVYPEFVPGGFASPGWTSPDGLEEILNKYKFAYCADYRCKGSGNVIKQGKHMQYLGVNLLGEPGGVAFFENCRCNGYTTEDIIRIVFEHIDKFDVTVIYDHPYYCGINEKKCLNKIIENILKEKQVKICMLKELI